MRRSPLPAILIAAASLTGCFYRDAPLPDRAMAPAVAFQEMEAAINWNETVIVSDVRPGWLEHRFNGRDAPIFFRLFERPYGFLVEAHSDPQFFSTFAGEIYVYGLLLPKADGLDFERVYLNDVPFSAHPPGETASEQLLWLVFDALEQSQPERSMWERFGTSRPAIEMASLSEVENALLFLHDRDVLHWPGKGGHSCQRLIDLDRAGLLPPSTWVKDPSHLPNFRTRTLERLEAREARRLSQTQQEPTQ